MENYYFFDSNTSIGDRRLYASSDWSKVLSKFLENGIYNENDNLNVTADGTGMTINVGAGCAFIDGHMYENTVPLALNVDAAEATMDRIDLVVLRLDLTEQNRFMKCFVVKGDTAGDPVAPVPVDSTFIKEIALAEIRVTAAKSTIDQVQITDRRPGDLVEPFVDGSRITALENEMDNLPNLFANKNSEIVEMGTNANGSYVRFGNGLQICWGSIEVPYSSGGNTGSISNVPFPATFKTELNVRAGVGGTPFGLILGISAWVNNGTLNIQAQTVSGTFGGNGTFAAIWEAIGWWK